MTRKISACWVKLFTATTEKVCLDKELELVLVDVIKSRRCKNEIIHLYYFIILL